MMLLNLFPIISRPTMQVHLKEKNNEKLHFSLLTNLLKQTFDVN